MQKKITIVGAGLAGSLCALFLIRRGFRVSVFERRSDLRKETITAGKSINLALSKRGITALKSVGVDKEVMKIAIPMYKRVMHDKNGILTDQPYGNEGQAIFSISRARLNVLMMRLAEQKGAVLNFNEKCIDANFTKSKVVFENTKTKQRRTVSSDIIVGGDGAFSSIRKQMVDSYGHKFSYNKIDHLYKELHIPAGKDGAFLLDKNALHIWPRGEFMLIALANLDGSFTCTLFAPKTGNNSFENLEEKLAVEHYFRENFSDFFDLVPDLYDQWNTNPTSELGIIKTYPWHVNGKAVLIGDAAHATVPFYGQGMNASLEDCRILDDLLNKYNDDFKSCFSSYSKSRKPNGDGLQNLSMHNYIVMRERTADPMFLLQKKIEAKFGNLYPDKWIPLYSMVSFTNIPYNEAWKLGMHQEKIMSKVMSLPNIENCWNEPIIMEKILALV